MDRVLGRYRSGSSPAFVTALSGVRRRWRARHASLGIAIFLGVLLVALWVASFVLQQARFSAESVWWSRWGLGLVLGGVAARWLVYPLLRPLSDARLALYVEERVPSLGGAVLSAVEVAAAAASADTRSPILTQELYADAGRRLTRTREVKSLESLSTWRALAVALTVLASGAALIALGPAWIGQSARLLATPWRDAERSPVYAIEVTPGDATIARGSDFQVAAEVQGFTADIAELSVRRGPSGSWDRIPMGPGGDSARFTARLFDVGDDVEYFVEANGVRSAIYRLTVRDLPAVRQIDLEVRFPAYTGLAPEHLDDAGDIAAVRGSTVTLHVRTSRAVRGGRIRLAGDSTVALTLQNDSTLAATLIVRADGFYRVELDAADGTRVAGNVDYVIDAIDDQPPVITVRKPGRDVRPSNVEEVFIEAEASDDFGIGVMTLTYRINGGDERSVSLSDGKGRRRQTRTAGHTLFLEELGLEPGDVLTYYVRAWDNDAVSGAKSVTSDIYFLTIRPFDREYKQNQQGGGGGGGGGESDPGTLVARQKEIVAATFKSDRDRGTTRPDVLRTDITTIHLSQGQIRASTAQLVQRLQRPAVQAADSGFRVIAQYLQTAMVEMQAAEEQLGLRKLPEALPPAQRALQMLERGEAVFKEVQVSMGQEGGGGGGGAEAKAESLADLFELETDKLRNQYEQVQRDAQQQANSQVDETLERLKRLAARQQQENERSRQRGQPGSAGGGGGASQRQLAEEAEDLARRLERLAREQSSPEMQQTAQALQDAAKSMRRSAATDGTQGRGSASSALDRLESARRLLEEGRGQRVAQSVEEAAERSQRLADEQRRVREAVSGLRDGSGRAEEERRLDERKDAMAQEVEQLEKDLDQLARDARREKAQTSSKLQSAATAIRDGRIKDKIRFSKSVMRDGTKEYANRFEEQIEQDLDSLRNRMVGAARAATSDSAQRSARALTQARNLVRALASIDDRMRERAGSAPTARGDTRGDAIGDAGGDVTVSPESRRGLRETPNGQSSDLRGPKSVGGNERSAPAGQRSGPGGSAPGGQGTNAPPPNANGSGAGGGQGKPTVGSFSAEDARQFSRELRAQREAAEGLRQELGRDGRSTADLDRLIARLRELESGRSFRDADQSERLRGAVLDGFKEFEFSLRRQLGERDRDGPVLGGNDEVPAGYRELVSEYFRSLSKKPKP